MSRDFQNQNLRNSPRSQLDQKFSAGKENLKCFSRDTLKSTSHVFIFCLSGLLTAGFSLSVFAENATTSAPPKSNPQVALTANQKKKVPPPPSQTAPSPSAPVSTKNVTEGNEGPSSENLEKDYENALEQDNELNAEAEESLELPTGDERVSTLEDGDEPVSNEDASASVEEATLPIEDKNAEKAVAPIDPPAQIQKKQQQAMAVDEEESVQKKILRKKLKDESFTSDVREKDRFPRTQPLFKLPPGPTQGGKARIPHPRAKNGLVSISSEGIYQYKTKMKDRTQSGSFKVGMMSPPTIDSGRADITYESMYGNSNVTAFRFDYEWQPFSSSKNIGIRTGSGLAVATGSGFFKTTNTSRTQTRAEEKYTLYMVPLSAFGSYRFEYSKKQWVVPYILAGAEGYALAEIRSDNKGNNFAFSYAAGGGGGILLPISRLDAHQAFTLSEEYGVSDMWLALEGMYLQGLNSDIDFSNSQLNLGIQIDF